MKEGINPERGILFEADKDGGGQAPVKKSGSDRSGNETPKESGGRRVINRDPFREVGNKHRPSPAKRRIGSGGFK